MSLLLYRLGRTAYRRSWAFIALWLVLLAGTAGLAVANGGANISSSVTIDGTESQDVTDRLRAELPQAAGGQGTIVFTVPEGDRLDQGARAKGIAEAAADISELPIVVDRTEPTQKAASAPDPTADPQASRTPSEGTPADASQPSRIRPLVADGKPVPGVVVSEDGSVAMLQIQFTEQVQDLPDGSVEQVTGLAENGTAGTGVDVLTTESLKPHEAPVGGTEALGLGVAALVLLLTLGSLRAAGLPLVTALTGVGIGLGGAFALSQTITLTTATPVLALMVGLAVGIDYALFIVNRQRRLILTQGLDAEEATSRAIGTAGSAVLFAGLTVVIALTGLTLIGISFLTTMALVAAVTVVLAVLVALTLLPALLGLVGERIASDKARAKGAAITTEEHRHFAHRWSGGVVRYRWLAIIGVIAVLAAAAVPVTSMSLGMPNGSTANFDTDERQAYDAITRGFGEGYNAPLVVVATPQGDDRLDEKEIGQIAAELRETPVVRTVSIMGADPDGGTAIFTVIPEEGPDAASTSALVDSLRLSGATVAGSEQVSLGVTGLTAVNIDISEKLRDVLPLYIGIVVALSLIVLMLVFRSLVIPVKATLGFLLSIGATFGLMTAIFQWGWLKDLFGFDTTGPILSFLPIMVTGILYGLAMDYEMFLVSSMREAHVHGHRGRDAIVHGFDQASRVVVAAAVIMVSVFAGFIFSSDPTIKQFGLALAVGILIDAFLVRMTLVPALMSVLGEAAWWLPRRLAAVLPNLDVEGDQLKQHLVEEATPALATAAQARAEGGLHRARRGLRVRRPLAVLPTARPETPTGNGTHSEGARRMTFQIPPSRKNLPENRFEFTLDGAILHDLPLLPYAPLVAVEAFEDGRALNAVLASCDSEGAREVIRQLDADQFRAFVEAWELASAERADRLASPEPVR
ncbi:MAG TPA: MMPL family transporter [Intrasporangium sp.]|uniref:MMPL family transporter n=1 Tax=Intrasporangium sp. TaxID=1925024 RepID=UPI002B494362|nr:MMPL family transporter [Intrasporangium sp.]HKX68505.1 MMPL family transporter [Intrasporangium sp.]